MRRLAVLLLLLAAAAPALPGIGASDPRRRVDIRAAPWRAVALLQIPGVGHCTAFLVAPTTAVTAAHCLFSARLGHWAPPDAVHVLTGYELGQFARHSVAAGYRVAAGYDPARAGATRGADIAMVQLAATLIDAAAVLRVADAPVGATVMLGGYDQDRPEVIEADMACRILGAAADGEGRALLGHDCAATRGSSGAPILWRDPDGTWTAAGVQVGGHLTAVGGVAVPAAALRRLLGVGSN